MRVLAFLLLNSCSYVFHATLVPDAPPQNITCKLSPDTTLIPGPKVSTDLTAYLYNPAIQLHCFY